MIVSQQRECSHLLILPMALLLAATSAVAADPVKQPLPPVCAQVVKEREPLEALEALREEERSSLEDYETFLRTAELVRQRALEQGEVMKEGVRRADDWRDVAKVFSASRVNQLTTEWLVWRHLASESLWKASLLCTCRLARGDASNGDCYFKQGVDDDFSWVMMLPDKKAKKSVSPAR